MVEPLAAPPCVVIVCEDSDLLASHVQAHLTAQGDPVVKIRPGILGSLAIRLHDEHFWVAGQRVGGILFRSHPDATFSADFQPADRAFCDAEVRAVWLAAMHLDSVCAINRYDAAAWFEGAYWPVWRRRLIARGIPVSSFDCGESGAGEWWYPYRSDQPQPPPGPTARRMLGASVSSASPAQRTLAVNGEILAGDGPAGVVAAIEALAESGTRLVEVITDRAERVLAVDVQPLIADPALAELASKRLGAIYHAHLHRW